ncbi:Cytosine/adenosine deaminase [Actinopolyspora xinjiangensis]|uniref:Cytosine/adenosine deaminase n=2 Tax=Actinopolyspora xinjiangensis TaxID=405564 RepID=A0A1H0VQS1_9ACTN|nr:Cytosine/adenosine deaminase [Actinopolyspora xinjiangensis]
MPSDGTAGSRWGVGALDNAVMPITRRLRAPVVLPCDETCSVQRDAVVDIDEQGRLGYCGPRATAPEPDADTVVRDCPGLLMPGLVNTHAHTPMTLLRGMGGDLPLLRWLREVVWPAEARLRPSDIRAGMQLGSMEMLTAGVTTSAEMYFAPESVADAVLEVGSRVVIASAVIDMPDLGGLGGWQGMVDRISRWIDSDGLRFGPGERVELAYGPHSAYMLPTEALCRISEQARERGALVHTHVAETAEEDAEQRRSHGSVPRMLAELGVLEGRFLAAHGVHLDDTDIAVLAEHGVSVAHCPGSNAKLASGTARLVELLRAGVPLGLGTDGPSSNDDVDLWEEVQFAGMLARLREGDADAVRASELLLAATRGGARALHRSDIGALESGRWADVVHLDLDTPAFVRGSEATDERILSNLVWAAGAECVRDVWVAGEQVVDTGEPTRVERDTVLKSARAAARRIEG